jgi:hypothetical protein
MNYKDRNAKDRKILVRISKLSFPARFKRIQGLEFAVKNAQADVEQKTSNKARDKKQRAQLMADEDGIIELRCRLALERTEYLALKEITPDYKEPVPNSGENPTLS